MPGVSCQGPGPNYCHFFSCGTLRCCRHTALRPPLQSPLFLCFRLPWRLMSSPRYTLYPHSGFLWVFLLYLRRFFGGLRPRTTLGYPVGPGLCVFSHNALTPPARRFPTPGSFFTSRCQRGSHPLVLSKRDRLFSDIFLRFLESLFGGRVLFVFVRNM
jgi:hypothetical protein